MGWNLTPMPSIEPKREPSPIIGQTTKQSQSQTFQRTTSIQSNGTKSFGKL
jgi:hypothetical protein